MTQPASNDRPLSDEERNLVRWMLEHGSAKSRTFLPQLDLARVTSWRCPCGCASIDFVINGHPKNSSGGMHLIADFIFGNEADLSGIFVFERNGVLAGLEVYGLTGNAPKSLPHPDTLRPFPGKTVT